MHTPSDKDIVSKEFTHKNTPRGEEVPVKVQSAWNNDATVSTLLIPGETVTATMLDFWSLGLTMGTVLVPSVVFGTWAAGRESRMRCRWRVNTLVRRDRIPSERKIDLEGLEEVVGKL